MSDLPDLEPTDGLPAPEAEAAAEDEWDWQEFLAGYFGEKSGDEGPSDGAEGQPADAEEAVPDGDSPPVGDKPPEPEPELPPAAEQPQFIEIAGRQIPAHYAPQLAELYDFIQGNPREAMAFLDVLEGKATVVPASAPQPEPQPEPQPQFQPPTDEDWEFVPETLRQKVGQVDQLAEKFNEFEQFLAAQRQAEAEARAAEALRAIDEGVTRFRETYDVADEDLEKLRAEAAQLGVAGRLQEQYGGDAVRAVRDALEIAYLRNPEYREREIERRATQALADQERQAKLGALTGSGGSAPRSEPRPSTADQRQASIVDAVRAAMNGG